MTTQQIAAALRRVEAVLERRPETGLHDDAPAADAVVHSPRSDRVAPMAAPSSRSSTGRPSRIVISSWMR